MKKSWKIVGAAGLALCLLAGCAGQAQALPLSSSAYTEPETADDGVKPPADISAGETSEAGPAEEASLRLVN